MSTKIDKSAQTAGNGNTCPAVIVPPERSSGSPAGFADGRFRAILEARMAARLEAMRNESRLAQKVRTIREEARQQLAGNIGEEALTRWRRYVGEARQKVRLQRNEHAGKSDYPDVDYRLQKEMKAEAESMRRELGIAESIFRDVHRGVIERLEALPGSRISDGSGVLHAVEADQLKHGGLELGWLIFEPPFLSEDFSVDGWQEGFAPAQITPNVAGLEGRIGQRLRYENRDASNFDVASFDAHAINSVIFTAPATGNLEVQFGIRPEVAQHELLLRDEFGISEATVIQRNWITLQIFGSEAGALQTSMRANFKVDGESDGSWNQNFETQGEIQWFQFTSDRPYHEGELLWMDIGSDVYHFAITDDVEVYSTLNVKWIIEQVLVRTI